MFKQLKATTMMGAISVALLASAPVFSQTTGAIPSSAREFSMIDQFWSEGMMNAMDKNKDGTVTRQEFLDYMGAQFDRMDAKKKGMLNKAEFMDKKMMSSTFPSAAKE